VLGRYAPGARRASGPVPVIADVSKENMLLSYRNQYVDYWKHHELLNGSEYQKLRSQYHAGLFLPVGIGVAGFLGTLANNPASSFIIVTGLIGYLFHVLPYKKHFDRSMRVALQALPEKDIILEIKEDGLHETMDGIKSFCPWASIRYFQIFREVVFISLASDLWAIIPSRFLTQSGFSLSDLRNVLRAHNVNEKS